MGTSGGWGRSRVAAATLRKLRVRGKGSLSEGNGSKENPESKEAPQENKQDHDSKGWEPFRGMAGSGPLGGDIREVRISGERALEGLDLGWDAGKESIFRHLLCAGTCCADTHLRKLHRPPW